MVGSYCGKLPALTEQGSFLVSETQDKVNADYLVDYNFKKANEPITIQSKYLQNVKPGAWGGYGLSCVSVGFCSSVLISYCFDFTV